MSAETGRVELGCVTMGSPPATSWFLQDTRTGERNGESHASGPDYSPWVNRIDGDSLGRLRADLRLQDLPHSQARDTQVIIRTYRPEAHFTRQVVIPDIRLNDWRPQ
jgi:hypothetical protein